MVIAPIKAILETIIGFFEQILSWLNPWSDEFILKDPIKFLKDIVGWLNPFSDNFILKPITNLISDFFSTLFSYLDPTHDNFILKKIIEFFVTLLDLLNPFSDNFILKIAFVPEENFFSEKFNGLMDIIKSKFLFIDQLASIINPTYYTVEYSSSAPNLSFTLPEKYGGGTYQLIDFSFFDEYKEFIFAFMRVIIWFPFLKWLYGRIPTLINGGMGMDYRNQHTGEYIHNETGEVTTIRTSGRLNK